MKMSIALLLLAAQAGAEVIEGEPYFNQGTGGFEEDVMGDGTYIFSVIEHESHAHKTPRPSREWYPQLYASYPLRFVKGLPKILDQMAGKTYADLYTLSAPISESAYNTMVVFHGPGAKARQAAKHSGFGMLIKDHLGNEVGRIAATYWAISNTDQNVPKLNEAEDTVTFLNRALTTYSVSKGSWEGGYWDTAKKLTAKPISAHAAYHKFDELMTGFANKYPQFQAVEMRDAKTDAVIQPGIVCNSMIEYFVRGFTGKEALQDNLAEIGQTVVKVPHSQSKPVDQKTAAAVARGEHFTKFKVLSPFLYNHRHELQSLHETPTHFFAYTPSGYYVRHNFNAGDLLPQSKSNFLASIRNQTKAAIEKNAEKNELALAKAMLGATLLTTAR